MKQGKEKHEKLLDNKRTDDIVYLVLYNTLCSPFFISCLYSCRYSLNKGIFRFHSDSSRKKHYCISLLKHYTTTTPHFATFSRSMKYELLNQSYELPFIERLLTIRNIASDSESFFQPSFTNTWHDPFLLNDMKKAVDHIIQAMKNHDKIMIFGDYDVDGVTASYCLYKFLRYFLKYSEVSIMYPNRKEDGY